MDSKTLWGQTKSSGKVKAFCIDIPIILLYNYGIIMQRRAKKYGNSEACRVA